MTILLQLSDVSARVVWQEFWACMFVYQMGIITAIVIWLAWRAYRTYSSQGDEIARLKDEEKQRGKSRF